MSSGLGAAWSAKAQAEGAAAAAAGARATAAAAEVASDDAAQLARVLNAAAEKAAEVAAEAARLAGGGVPGRRRADETGANRGRTRPMSAWSQVDADLNAARTWEVWIFAGFLAA